MSKMQEDIASKSMALTILVDWSNQDKIDETSIERAYSTPHPSWLCVHFGPPSSPGLMRPSAWQFTMNVYSTERRPTAKQDNEEPISKERRALLWFNAQPVDKYRHAIAMQQHSRFPSSLMPRMVTFHADIEESDINALVWVREDTFQKRQAEDSYFNVVKGHVYHLQLTFPDASLVNQYFAMGWGFTASLFRYTRENGHVINVSSTWAITQMRANWLAVVEAEPDELEIGRVAKFKDERDDQAALTKKNKSAAAATTTSSSGGELPTYKELASYVPISSHIDLGPRVNSFFDAPPSAPSTSTQTSSAVVYSKSDNELLSLFRALEQKAKSIATESNNGLRDAALQLTKVLSHSGKLVGWQFYERYMIERVTRARAAVLASEPMDAESDHRKKETQGKMDALIDKSQELLKNAMMRAQWVLTIENLRTKVGKRSEGNILEHVLEVLLKNTEWMAGSADFLKEAEEQVYSFNEYEPRHF